MDGNFEKWSSGKVIDKTGPVSAKIEMEDTKVVRWHHDQIGQTPTTPKTVLQDNGNILTEGDSNASQQSIPLRNRVKLLDVIRHESVGKNWTIIWCDSLNSYYQLVRLISCLKTKIEQNKGLRREECRNRTWLISLVTKWVCACPT